MTYPSVRYAALRQDDDMEQETSTSGQEEFVSTSGIEYGMPKGSFDSAFTYANYNDLDKMGYEAPKRYGNILGNRYSHFTYSNKFEEDDKEIIPMNTIELVIYVFSVIFVVLTLPFSLLFVLKFVSTSERLVVLRLGRAQKTRGPGATFILPCIDNTYKISTTITAFNVPPLQVITIDRGLVELGATVFLRIRDPILAVCSVQDRNKSTRTLANTMLYRYISRKRICEITNSQDRRILAGTFKDELGSFTAIYGVEITDVEMSDVKIIQEGENMGIAALSAVAKSDAGQKLWEVIAPHVEEFARETTEREDIDTENCEECSFKEPEEETLIDLTGDNTFDEDRLITVINMAIDDQLAKAVGRVFQINCVGVSPMYIDLKRLPCACVKGTAPNPDVVFEMSRAVFLKMITEELSPLNAYMQGSLKVMGSIQDALSLKYLAERVKQLL
ncbi:SPFH/Band 7/PHB domain protein [Necator americanus]|uniref:SPFH/Band 7/PHB domain protein n=1 Tax=Necator americanus TaxID=51031 RepID=W2SRC0_NECAM|nr:SPFH/Band 7/PHB domain protein [Necator americanus]ETN71242.1 SPFH/Band 7/PHB domain protein [Necator americanus]